jgi:hypothetical protein
MMLTTMGGVNPTIQLAAALDRRGVTVSVDVESVRIHIGGYREYIVVQPRASGINAHDIGRYWFWNYGGEADKYPRDDYEGAADAIEKFLRNTPGLAATRLLYRMDHMGWTFEQETQEALERARRKNKSNSNGSKGSRPPGKPGVSDTRRAGRARGTT